jgi:hypothetical protein
MILSMSKNVSKKNEAKLRLYLAEQQKKNDIKTSHTKVRRVGVKPSAD